VNKYLQAKRDEYEALRKSIEGFQTRAADETRDLTEVELTTVTEQGDQARKLLAEIESLTEIEHRNRKVAQLAADLDAEPEVEVRTTSTKTRERDPGHYRSERDGGRQSFFADIVTAREGNDDAVRRLRENEVFQAQTRALTSSSAGTGVLPPQWLTDEYAAIARQTRRVADKVRNIPITDARPLSLPKQTAGTTIATQSSESSATSFTDAFTSNVDTVTPTTQVGGQKVSRQLLDGASPAVDQLLYGDLIAAYNSKVETLVCSAMVTGAGTATTAYATEAAYTTAITPTATGVPFLKNLRAAATSVRNLRKLPPDLVIAAVSRYGGWLDITDTQGRPLIPVAENNPVNANGTGSAMVDGRILGLEVVATDGLPFQTYPESILVARSMDTLLFESATLRFRYDEPDGPETVRLGVWGYAVAFSRYASASAQRLQVTAA
jgi:hypothetical protein